MYLIVPSHPSNPDVSFSGTGALSVFPHTSCTTGNVVGSTAADSHATVLDVLTGPPTSAGGVDRSTVYVYTQSCEFPSQSM